MSTTDTSQLEKRLADLLSFFGVNAQIECTETEEEVVFSVASDGGGRLIGHHGENLAAIQHIMGMLGRRSGERRRITVDIGGYKRAREHYLQQAALQAADSVVKSRSEEALAPMNPAERRIVHQALTERSDIETESRGEEPKRFIVVKPAAQE